MTARDESHHECVEEMTRENGHIQQKDSALKLGISKKKEWGTLSIFLDSKKIMPSGYQKIDR